MDSPFLARSQPADTPISVTNAHTMRMLLDTRCRAMFANPVDFQEQLPFTGMRPSVQMHNFAVDEMRRLEVQHQLRNFLDLRHAPERAKPPQKVMRRCGVHRSVDDPW